MKSSKDKTDSSDSLGGLMDRRTLLQRGSLTLGALAIGGWLRGSVRIER